MRVAHNEVSVSDPDAVAQVLLPKHRKVSLPDDAPLMQGKIPTPCMTQSLEGTLS